MSRININKYVFFPKDSYIPVSPTDVNNARSTKDFEEQEDAHSRS